MLLQHANFDYVSKMVYNKDKDLVFVYKPTGLWGEQEYIYEMHHLEQMVPYAVKALENHSFTKDDGILTVMDMNSKDALKLYNENKYWNLDLKDEFMASTRGLWKGNFDSKYDGSIFKLRQAVNPLSEEALTVSHSAQLVSTVLLSLVIEGRKRTPRSCCQAWRSCGTTHVRGRSLRKHRKQKEVDHCLIVRNFSGLISLGFLKGRYII